MRSSWHAGKGRKHFHSRRCAPCALGIFPEKPDPKINPAVTGPDAGCSWSCRELGSENDLVAEGIEAADQTLGHAMLVLLVEMSGTEFTELSVTSKDVEHREQDLVSDDHRGAFGTQAGFNPNAVHFER
jgi:hypothetical protein